MRAGDQRAGDDGRALRRRADAQDRGLRRVGQRRDALDLLRADVGEREAGAADVLRAQRAAARGPGQAHDLGLDSRQRAGVGVAHDRDDQTVRRVGRDADPDPLERRAGGRVGAQLGVLAQQPRERVHREGGPAEIAPRRHQRVHRVDPSLRLDLRQRQQPDLAHLAVDRAPRGGQLRRAAPCAACARARLRAARSAPAAGAPCTSESVMRPRGPVPRTSCSATPRSRASRRAAGDATTRPLPFAAALARNGAARPTERAALRRPAGSLSALARGAAGALVAAAVVRLRLRAR